MNGWMGDPYGLPTVVGWMDELTERNKNINRGFRKLTVWKEAIGFMKLWVGEAVRRYEIAKLRNCEVAKLVIFKIKKTLLFTINLKYGKN